MRRMLTVAAGAVLVTGGAAATAAAATQSHESSAKKLTLARLERDIVYGYPFSVGGETYRAFTGAPRWMVSPMLPVRAVEKRLHLHGSCVLVLLPSNSGHPRGWVLCRDGQVRKVG